MRRFLDQLRRPVRDLAFFLAGINALLWAQIIADWLRQSLCED